MTLYELAKKVNAILGPFGYEATAEPRPVGRKRGTQFTLRRDGKLVYTANNGEVRNLKIEDWVEYFVRTLNDNGDPPRPPPAEVSALSRRLREVCGRRREMEQEYEAALRDVRDEEDDAREDLRNALARHYCVTQVEMSLFHECRSSPVGVCLYDEYQDPEHDCCLVCHQPEERK